MNKDNPVPSIDNLKPPKNKCNSYLDGWFSAKQAVKELQNGVETNKVQPKCSRCHRDKHFCGKCA